MKEKLIKLFFDEEEIIISKDQTMDVKSATELIGKINLQEKYNFIKRGLNVIVIFLSIFVISHYIFKFIFPDGPFTYEYIHNLCFYIFMVIISYMLVNFSYVKKITVQYIDKKVIKVLKKFFVSLIFIVVLGIHNVYYEMYSVLKFSNYTYLIAVILTIVLVILTIVLGLLLLNKIFKNIDKLQSEMDSVI